MVTGIRNLTQSKHFNLYRPFPVIFVVGKDIEDRDDVFLGILHIMFSKVNFDIARWDNFSIFVIDTVRSRQNMPVQMHYRKNKLFWNKPFCDQSPSTSKSSSILVDKQKYCPRIQIPRRLLTSNDVIILLSLSSLNQPIPRMNYLQIIWKTTKKKYLWKWFLLYLFTS